jgi:hypothetical protein
MNNVQSMFESIKSGLKESEGKNNNFKNILRLERDNTYKVRLIPNAKSPKDTFFHYYHHGWTSLATNGYVDIICPTTWGDRCPICEHRFKLWRNATSDDDKDLARKIKRMEKWLVNIYVEECPPRPDNIGKVMILRYGVKIQNKISEAMEGEDSEDFGPRIFDLSEEGCSLRIKVDTQMFNNKKVNNYDNSRFLFPSAIEDMTEERIEEIYNECFELPDFIEHSTPSELQNMLDVHLYCKVEEEAAADSEEVKADISEAIDAVADSDDEDTSDDEDDQLPGLEQVEEIDTVEQAEEILENPKKTRATSKKSKKSTKKATEDLINDLDNI